MTWDAANTACGLAGGRLPTIEELKTLADAQCEALGSTDCTSASTRNPPGFQASGYWSSTTVPSDITSAYYVHFGIGALFSISKEIHFHVRCVR